MPEKKMSRRQERVNSRIVQEVSAILRDINDERIGFITVTRCEVSPDLRHANVYISVFGEDMVKMETMRAIKDNTSYVRKCLGQVMNTKVTPEINFKIEKRIDRSADISELIKEARASDPHPDSSEQPDESEDNTNE